MGRGYTIFDTALGRCGVAWSDAGVVGVQLPEAREIETLRRLFRLFPEARELQPSPDVENAIDGIVKMLRGQDGDLSDVALDVSDVSPIDQRVYDYVRSIPRGETRSHVQIAAHLDVAAALHCVANALAKNPFPLIVPCHRVLDPGSGLDKVSPHNGVISRRRLLTLEGSRRDAALSLFDVLLSADRPRAAH
jgi:methylated-DNA-[protein]-cysteine S-methyltransferase